MRNRELYDNLVLYEEPFEQKKIDIEFQSLLKNLKMKITVKNLENFLPKIRKNIAKIKSYGLSDQYVWDAEYYFNDKKEYENMKWISKKFTKRGKYLKKWLNNFPTQKITKYYAIKNLAEIQALCEGIMHFNPFIQYFWNELVECGLELTNDYFLNLEKFYKIEVQRFLEQIQILILSHIRVIATEGWDDRKDDLNDVFKRL